MHMFVKIKEETAKVQFNIFSLKHSIINQNYQNEKVDLLLQQRILTSLSIMLNVLLLARFKER